MPDEVRRLIACGIAEGNAWSIYYSYSARGDWDALEDLILECQLLYNDYKQYPREE